MLVGLFDKLFGGNKNTSVEIQPTGKMMDDEKFWNLISDSITNSSSQDSQENYLTAELIKQNPEEIIGFHLRMDQLLRDSYNSDLWCAAYIINGGCSDDGFDYFRSWLISRGKESYAMALKKPDNLVQILNEDEETEFEGFLYVGLNAFLKKTGKDLYAYLSDDSESKGSAPSNIEFTWHEEDPESMKKICPELFEKYWNG